MHSFCDVDRFAQLHIGRKFSGIPWNLSDFCVTGFIFHFEGEAEVPAKDNSVIPLQIQIPTDTSQKGQKIITADITFDGKELGPVPDLMVNCDYTPPVSWGAWNPQKKKNLLIWIGNRMKQSKKLFK